MNFYLVYKIIVKMTSKSKKRRVKKKQKKKILPIIDPEFIINNQCWIPEENKTSYLKKTNSWFDINYTHKKQQLQNKKEKWIGKTDLLRVEHIEMYPTTDQKTKLLNWMESYRQLYNLTITNRSKFMVKGYMMSYPKIRTLIQQNYLPSKVNLSNEIFKTLLIKTDQIKYKPPAHSIWNAINDVTKAFTSAKANKDAGNIKSFRLRHKKKSNPIRTFVLEPGTFSVTKNAFAITALGEMKSSKPFGQILHDCRLSYSYLTDKFTLWKPYTKVTEIKHFKSDLIALDPGMRTFQTGYSPNGVCYKFATSITNKKIKDLFSKIYNVVKDGRRYKRFVKRIRKKITDMVTDLHWKTANFLCKNFATILIGNMSTTGIVKKEKSVLKASSKVYCIALSHYKFRERLLSKSAEHGVNCHIVDESYTTQTCGKCGQRNLNVGSDKVFKCTQEQCTFKLDRDYNGGRNIYLKSLSKKIIV
jgi:transposase